MSSWRKIGEGAEPCKHEVTDIANIFDRKVFRCQCGREVPEVDVEQWDRPKGMTPFQVASYLLNEGYAA